MDEHSNQGLFKTEFKPITKINNRYNVYQYKVPKKLYSTEETK